MGNMGGIWVSSVVSESRISGNNSWAVGSNNVSGVSSYNWSMMSNESEISIAGMSVGFVGQMFSLGDLVGKGFNWDSVGINDWKVLWSSIDYWGCKISSRGNSQSGSEYDLHDSNRLKIIILIIL